MENTVLSQKVMRHAKIAPEHRDTLIEEDIMVDLDDDFHEHVDLETEEDLKPRQPSGPGLINRVKDWISDLKVPCNDAQKACIVRVYRWIAFFVLIAFAYVSIYIYLDDTTVNEDFKFSGSELNIEVSACRLTFKKGTNSDVTAHISSQIRASYFNSTQPDNEYFDTTDTSLKMRNPNEDVEACDIQLESSSFPDLIINCEEFECPITADDDDISFGGKLEIRHSAEADGNVYFKRMEVNEVFINITGTMSVEQLTTNQGGTIISNDGDIWLQSQQEANVNWKTFVSSAYQFVGPNARHVSPVTCDTQNITLSNSTFEVNNCEGHTVTCITAGCAGEFSLDLQATDGGVYIHLLESPGKLYNSISGIPNALSWRDDENLLRHSLDLLSKIKIQEIRDELEGEVIYDQFVSMTMAGVNYDIGKWLFTTKEAYTQLKPWWIQLISFGLLLPRPKQMDIRLVPWPYILSGPYDDDDMSLMGPVWNIIFSEFGADPDYFLLWMEDSEDADNWYEIWQDKFNEYKRDLQQLTDNTPLLIALWFSFALGLVGAVAGAGAAWWALTNYSDKFWSHLDHKKRYKRIQLLVGKRQENYDQNFRDSIEEIDLKPASGKGRFPPPFSVVDLLVTTYQKENYGSLEEFLKVVVKPETEEQIYNPIYKVKDIKERYESFCFANEFGEQVIRHHKDVLKKHGFEISTLSDSTTEAFKNIRQRTDQEIRDEPDVRQIPGEDSLHFFVRAQYAKTPFESDIIFLTSLIAEYEKFVKKNKNLMNFVPFTKRAMVSMGFEFERLTVNVVKSRDGKHKLVLQIADELIYKPINNPMPAAWYLYDIMAIIMHCVMIWLLLAPILGGVIFWQHLHANMSTRPVDQFITLQDIQYRPWLILEKAENFEIWTIVVLSINGLILLLSIIELLCYYATRDVPFSSDRLLDQENKFHKYTQNIFFVLIHALAAIVSGYVVIGLCWCILGAVLNPEVFLPYAAAAITLISFVFFKIKGAVDNWQGIFREIQEMLMTRMNFMLHEMLDRVIGKMKSDAAADVGEMGAALASGRYLYALQKTPLGNVIDGLGLNPEMITAIANGEPIAITMIAEQFGVDSIIVEALSAAVTQDLEALEEVIPRLASIPGIDMDPEVAKALVNLAWNRNEINIRTSVKTAVIQFTRIMNNRLGLGMSLDNPGGSGGPVAAQIQAPSLTNQTSYPAQQGIMAGAQQLDINPRVIEALVDMANGDIMRLRDILYEFEKKELLPKHTCKIFDFLKCLNSHDHKFVKTLKVLLEAFCVQLDSKFTTGLGCLVSDKYHGFVQRTKNREKNFSASWPEIDDLLSVIDIASESIIVKVIMCLTRNSRQTLQRFIPELVAYLNERLGWKLSSKDLKSILTMINGVKLNINKLSTRWDVSPKAIRFFPSLMLCPFEYKHNTQISEKTVKEVTKKVLHSFAKAKDAPVEDDFQQIIGGSESAVEEVSRQLSENATVVPDPTVAVDLPLLNNTPDMSQPSPALLNLTQGMTQRLQFMTEKELEMTKDSQGDLNLKPYDVLSPRSSPIKEILSPRKVPEDPDKPAAYDPVEAHESPSVEILKHAIRPQGRSMTWIANKFKLQENVVMGIFVTVRRAYKEHNIYLEPLIKDVLRRIGLDHQALETCTNIYKLIVSSDERTIRDAHSALNLKFADLALIANKVMNPKNLKLETLTYLGFPPDDKLVQMRLKLDWERSSAQCEKWCRAVAIQITTAMGELKELKEEDSAEKLAAKKLTFLMARSLLMIAVRAPSLLIKKLMMINCNVDESDVYDFRTLIQAHYIKRMEPNSDSREEVIGDLSRLFEVPQESLSAFVDIALAQNYGERQMGMMKLLSSFNIDADTQEKINRVVADAKQQLDIVKDNVENFTALGELLGLPPTFIESLSPGIIHVLSENKHIMKKFINKFAREFGVDSPELQKSISAFVLNDSTGVEDFGQVFGLQEGMLTSAVKLFGVQFPEQSIEEISSFFGNLGILKDKITQNNAKAFSALIAGFTGKIKRERMLDSETSTFFAPMLLEKQLRIPRYVFKGLLNSIQKDEKRVKDAILKLCIETPGKFIMDDALCRGFLSIATGHIEGIEDICHIINYNADYAEVLVLLADQDEIIHQKLVQNTQFAALCVKVGLKVAPMAAMLALSQQDIDSSEEICAALGPEKMFPPDIIKAMMTVYKYNTINNEQHSSYDPKVKKQMMLENIKPLANLVEVNDSVVASFIVCLAQGNAGVIEDVFQRFGWNGIERTTYGALICLFHRYPFKDTDSNTGLFNWLAEKELGQVCACIASLFQLDVEGVEKVILCARQDNAALQWLAHHLKLNGITEARNFVRMITNDGDEISADDETQQEDELDEQIDWAALNNESYGQDLISIEDADTVILDDVTSVGGLGDESIAVMTGICRTNADDLTNSFNDKFERFKNILNTEYVNKIKIFTLDNIRVLMNLAGGKLSSFDKFEDIMEITYGAKPPISTLVVKELLAITSGKYKHVEPLLPPLIDVEDDKEEDTSPSIFKKLDLKPQQMEFLMKLASADSSWLSIEYKEAKISTQIASDHKIALAVFGLCSLDSVWLTMYVPKLSKYLEMDVEMAQILVLLSNQALNRAVLGVAPLAERLEVETQVTNSFCCMAYYDLSLRMDAIKPLCDRLEIQCIESVQAILTIIAGDYFVGWEKLAQNVIAPKPHEMNDEEKRRDWQDRVAIFQYLLQILKRRWDVKITSSRSRSRLGQLSSFKSTDELEPGKVTVNSKVWDRSNTGGVLQVNALSTGEKNDFLEGWKMIFGDDQIRARQRLAQAFGFKKNDELVDLIIGISQNKASIVGPTMRINHLDPKHEDLVASLLHLYNGNDSKIPIATSYIEKYIDENFGNENTLNEGNDDIIPHGLLTAIYGSVRSFNEVMVKGIARGLESQCNNWGWGEVHNVSMYQAVPLLMVYIGQPKSFLNYMTRAEQMEAERIIAEKLLGIDPDGNNIKIFKALISGNIKSFIKRLYERVQTGNPNVKELVMEIYDLALPEKRLSALQYITQKIKTQYNLTEAFAEAMILIISDTWEEDKQQKRNGMDEKFYTLISHFVDQLNSQIGSLESSNSLAKQMFASSEGETAIIKILDACYLAFKDPQGNADKVLDILPIVTRAFLGDKIPEKAIKLILGIIKLFKSEEDPQKKDMAIKDLSGAFDIDEHLVKGLLALAKGDWQAMKEMVARICEFDDEIINNIVQLILQLRKARAADNIQEKTEQTTDKYEQLKKRIPQGTDVEAVFDMLDVSNDGWLHFDEFQEAFKIYNLPMSQERQLEIFTRFDTDGGDNQLSLANFVAAMGYIRSEVTSQTMDDLGFSVRRNVRKILLAIFILLMIFVFIFLGIAGFTTNTTLGSVVNSLMPISAGGILSKAGGTEVTEVIKKIKDAVEQRLAVLTNMDV